MNRRGVFRRSLHRSAAGRGAALAACLWAWGCADDPSTIRLIVEAPAAAAPGDLPVDQVEVRVVGRGSAAPCGCEWRWSSADVNYPLVVDLVHGRLYEDVSIRVLWFASGAVVGRQYLYARFPPSGVSTVRTVLSTACRNELCESPEYAAACGSLPSFCATSACLCADPSLAPELLTNGWVGSCSADCTVPSGDAGADADAEADVPLDEGADAGPDEGADAGPDEGDGDEESAGGGE
ncbi:MAG: hypothetical protein JXB32_10075 [Deltaproteobacteria bacterium]|nr:hypothetical protein [Deltaproteobacteria bacterium]